VISRILIWRHVESAQAETVGWQAPLVVQLRVEALGALEQQHGQPGHQRRHLVAAALARNRVGAAQHHLGVSGNSNRIFPIGVCF